MIKLAIVEDSRSDYEILINYLHVFENENGVEFDVRHFVSAEDFLADYTPIYDLIFMDVQLSGINGMKAAQILRKTDENTCLIFITNMKQYACMGYDVGAMGYVLKPIKYMSLALSLKRSMRSIQTNANQGFIIKSDGESYVVNSADIIYLEIVNHYLHIVTNKREYSVYGDLKSYESKLTDKGFYRCNSGVIINLRYIKSVDNNEIIMKNDYSISISRRKKKEFTTIFKRFYGGK